jgi:hypothetical protein
MEDLNWFFELSKLIFIDDENPHEYTWKKG